MSLSQGEYNHPWVSVYVSLEGVGEVKDNVTCNFTSDSFDLKVRRTTPPYRSPQKGEAECRFHDDRHP